MRSLKVDSLSKASGSPVGVGYIQPRKISGWEMTGGYGVNITGVGPFADNGAAPDQDLVLFLQGRASDAKTPTAASRSCGVGPLERLCHIPLEARVATRGGPKPWYEHGDRRARMGGRDLRDAREAVPRQHGAHHLQVGAAW